MRTIISAFEGELRSYKKLAEGALAQLADDQLGVRPPGGGEHGNSVATIAWHVAGNLKSRFTDFLTSDGEKPWRHRDSEFEPRRVPRAELEAKWEDGWGALLGELAALTDADLATTVYIRREPHTVLEALLRALAHVSYHVGQIVYAARGLLGDDWRYLSIEPGKTEEYNRKMGL